MKKILAFVLVSMVMLSPVFVHADPQDTGAGAGNPAAGAGAGNGAPAAKVNFGLPNPVGGEKGVNSLYGLFNKIFGFVIGLAYIVVAIFIVLSGFKFITAQGSTDKLNDAKHMFYGTIIGALLVIGAQLIAGVLKTVITQIATAK
ncbi:MAG TPA: hypothetical protein VIR98_01815 [Candidatus Paceibacterota bacterium]|jgi:hypothetical protein